MQLRKIGSGSRLMYFIYLYFLISCLGPVQCLISIMKSESSKLPAHVRCTDVSDLNISARNPHTWIPFDPNDSGNAGLQGWSLSPYQVSGMTYCNNTYTCRKTFCNYMDQHICFWYLSTCVKSLSRNKHPYWAICLKFNKQQYFAYASSEDCADSPNVIKVSKLHVLAQWYILFTYYARESTWL